MKSDATSTNPVPAEELAFNFRSGRLCLAFVATVGEGWRGNYERLRQPGNLSRWYQESGLVDGMIQVTPTGLDTARDVREAMYRAGKALIDAREIDPADEARINAAAAAPDLIPALHHGRSRLTAPPDNGETAALSTVARDAIDLFTGAFADRIRECDSPECALLFVDTSRPGRRRWCSSDACGSKDRSATYRQRRRDTLQL